MAHGQNGADFPIDLHIASAGHGDINACFDLGMAYSCGSGGVDVDLIQAHKWFNIAAMGGNPRGQECRAEIAGEMSAREIAEAQRQARAWLHGPGRATAH